jgi:GWxTD domain-containing protein
MEDRPGGNIMKFLTCAVLTTLVFMGLLSFEAYGQHVYSFEDYAVRDAFYLDYSQYKADQKGVNRLEIYYQVFNKPLQFVKDGNRFRADYEIILTIFDKDDRQVTAFSRENSFYVSSYYSTVSPGDFRVSQINLLVPPGKYKIEAQLVDKNSGNGTKKSSKAELIEYDSRDPQLSGIELVQFTDTAIIDTVFRKGLLSVVPSVARQYSGDTTTQLLFYQEIYQGSKARKDVLIETQILDPRLNIVYHDTARAEFQKDEESIRQVREIPLRGIKSGDYTLEVIIRGRRNRLVDRAKAPFTIYWSPEAMVLQDFEKAVNQLKYIASSDESKKLKETESAGERLALWKEFWMARDPSPGTPENEAMDRYYYRIEFANRNFSVLKKEGWRTDRGSIFMQYGAPDQIEDYPFELGAKAYQIWYYYQLKDPRKFIFVDEWGDGDFRLQYPYDGRWP